LYPLFTGDVDTKPAADLIFTKDSFMLRAFFVTTAILVSFGAIAEDAWPRTAKLYFIEPADGATITGKVVVKFGLTGLGVAPAGVDKPNTGHHHILVDTDAPTGIDLQNPLQQDDEHRHFGGGQTETVLDLKPGPHTLQLILGDQNHVPRDPPLVSQKIKIVVK
jgi:hypothetical protein